VNSKLKNLNLTIRKLKITDYQEFKKLFHLCFKKKVSFDFFKWRYFTNKSSFCYGVFKSSKLIANVGMISIKLNNYNQEKIFSRHSSMVLKKYRGLRIFSELQKEVKKRIYKKSKLIVMWPNKNNLSNFGIESDKIAKKKYYLYKSSAASKLVFKKKTKSYHINNLIKFKNNIKRGNSFFFKSFAYFKNRYFSYKKNEYYINEFKLKKLKSFFILKRNKNNSNIENVILDHFGSEEIKSKHLSNLLLEKNRLVFLAKSKIKNPNLQLLNYLLFKIGFINRFDFNKKKNILLNKEIFLGDTDIFISL